MANALKNSGLDVSTSFQSAYTCPSSTEAAVHNLTISNKDTTNQVVVSVRVFDSSLATNRVLFQDVPISVGGSFVYPKVINLEVGDKVEVVADVNGRADAFISVVERT